ncbi:hypothetical protein COP2_014912 [Malus domestica]
MKFLPFHIALSLVQLVCITWRKEGGDAVCVSFCCFHYLGRHLVSQVSSLFINDLLCGIGGPKPHVLVHRVISAFALGHAPASICAWAHVFLQAPSLLDWRLVTVT